MKYLSHNPYDDYYMEQAGNGLSVYRGIQNMKGHGIGSFLGGLFRSVIPLLRSGARTVGRQALKTTANVLGDMVEHRPFKESLKHRMNEAGDTLQHKLTSKIQKMSGSGNKSRKLKRSTHSSVKARGTRTSKKRKTVKKLKRKTTKKTGKRKLKLRTRIPSDIFN